MGEAIVKIQDALRDTREGGNNYISVGITTEFIECPRGIPCLHAPEVL